MSEQSETPRVDAEEFYAEKDTSDKWVQSSCNVYVVEADFARSLERELSEVTRKLDEAKIGDALYNKEVVAHAVTATALEAAERELEALRGLLREAQEEMRLIRMKDSPAVYDPTLRMRITAALTPPEK